MHRRLAVLIVFIFIASSAKSTPPENFPEITDHNNTFSLKRSVTVVADEFENRSALEVVKMLDAVGISAKVAKSASFKKAKIVIERVSKIDGVESSEAYQVKVAPNQVTVRYTDEKSRVEALKTLQGLIDGMYIRGNDVTVRGYNVGVETRVSGNYYDAAASYVPVNKIEEYARAQKNGDVYVKFVDTKHWRLESKIFAVINPGEVIYPRGEYYKLNQIHSLIDKLAKSKITLVPVIDILNPNEPFESLTGHSMFSVEGMRFIRAIIEEYAKELGCRKICIGKSSKYADERYVNFIRKVAHENGIELVILK